jgi:hypothetical protein
VPLQWSRIARTFHVGRDSELHRSLAVTDRDGVCAARTSRVPAVDDELVDVARRQPFTGEDVRNLLEAAQGTVAFPVAQLFGFDTESEAAVLDDRDRTAVRCLDSTDDHDKSSPRVV